MAEGGRAFGPQRVLLLVAYGVRGDGSRQLLAFTRTRAESQAAWEAFRWDLHERGLAGSQLQMELSDGCAGLAAAIETIKQLDVTALSRADAQAWSLCYCFRLALRSFSEPNGLARSRTAAGVIILTPGPNHTRCSS